MDDLEDALQQTVLELLNSSGPIVYNDSGLKILDEVAEKTFLALPQDVRDKMVNDSYRFVVELMRGEGDSRSFSFDLTPAKSDDSNTCS